jgi:carbamoyl-phosphate synthase/aspartate carbamoyltransferase
MRTIVERHGHVNLLNGKVICNLFYEPSTRTSASFESAMKRLGGQVINVNQVTSSVMKGESLEDTIRTLGNYSDGIVIRHPSPGSATQASKVSKLPVINAGDGIGEHPTQARPRGVMYIK